MISKETGAKVTRKRREVHITQGTKQQRDHVKLLIKRQVVGGLDKFYSPQSISLSRFYLSNFFLRPKKWRQPFNPLTIITEPLNSSNKVQSATQSRVLSTLSFFFLSLNQFCLLRQYRYYFSLYTRKRCNCVICTCSRYLLHMLKLKSMPNVVPIIRHHHTRWRLNSENINCCMCSQKWQALFNSNLQISSWQSIMVCHCKKKGKWLFQRASSFASQGEDIYIHCF